MKPIRALLNLKVLAAVLLLVLTVTTFIAMTSSSQAALGVWTYYSNASYTTVVGARGTGCCGQPINWGITTSYKRFQPLLCPDVLCPN